MIKNILGTAGTRILNALINLVILILLTNELGSEGFGVITIILVAITIIQLVIDLFAGSALIYYSSRTNIINLLIPSYSWILIVITMAWGVFGFLYNFVPDVYNLIIPHSYEKDILTLSFLNALMLTNYNLLLGKKRIKTYNYIFSVQILTLITSLVYFLYFQKDISVDAWVNSVYFAYSIGMILSTIAVVYRIGKLDLRDISSTIRKVFIFGFVTQLANMFHIANKRIGIYFLKMFTGISAVGVYGAGTQLTEGLRLIGQSISLVQFSEISNKRDSNFAIVVTIKLMKFSVVLTTLAVLILIILPTEVYSFVFSSQFKDLKLVIIALGPGVIALSMNTIFSHYYSGTGRPVVSLWANVIGFIVTIAFAIILIPVFGYVGAAATASASYISSVIYQYYLFNKETGTKFRSWMPDKNDYRDLRKILSEFKNKK